jgi:hypothetical protein
MYNDSFYTRQEIIDLCVNWFFDHKDITKVVEKSKDLTDDEFCAMILKDYKYKIYAVRKNRYCITF